MISGFNTDVKHEGCVYHVQTEERGGANPVLESLVYIGGTIVAKKATPYSDRLKQGATEDMIASLLKRQHRVIIAAIKAGRVEELISHSSKELTLAKDSVARPLRSRPQISAPVPVETSGATTPSSLPAAVLPEPPRVSQPSTITSQKSAAGSGAGPTTGGLNLDEVISDYLRRSSELEKLDLRVITPNVFTAGKTAGLRVQVSSGVKPVVDAVVTVKVIGTAFKPQVFVGRTGRDGVANSSIALPVFTAGTAAIVIEGKSSQGRGELKHLMRRA